MLGHVGPADLSVRLAGNIGQVLHGPRFRVGAYVIGVDEIGRGGNEQGCRVCVTDDQLLVAGGNFTALANGPNPRLVVQSTFNALIGGVVPAQHKAIGRDAVRHVVFVPVIILPLATADACPYGDATGFAGGKANHDDLINRTRKNLTLELHVSHAIGYSDDGLVHVQRAAIFADFGVSRKREPQIT